MGWCERRRSNFHSTRNLKIDFTWIPNITPEDVNAAFAIFEKFRSATESLDKGFEKVIEMDKFHENNDIIGDDYDKMRWQRLKAEAKAYSSWGTTTLNDAQTNWQDLINQKGRLAVETAGEARDVNISNEAFKATIAKENYDQILFESRSIRDYDANW